jgi:hypothetical protein
MQKQASPRGFRPAPEVEERLQYAEKLGLKINAVVNDLLREHLGEYLDKRKAELRRALNAPTP